MCVRACVCVWFSLVEVLEEGGLVRDVEHGVAAVDHIKRLGREVDLCKCVCVCVGVRTSDAWAPIDRRYHVHGLTQGERGCVCMYVCVCVRARVRVSVCVRAHMCVAGTVFVSG